jgi:signal transduction histidine kinase
LNGTPDLLNLFTEPAVALLYFLSVILLSQAALFMALGQRFRSPRDSGSFRYALASLGVMLVWITLMAGAMFVLLTRQPAGLILPPLDRAIMAMVVTIIAWAFLTVAQAQVPRPSTRIAPNHNVPPFHPPSAKWITGLYGLIAVAILVGYGYTAYQWFNTGVGQAFNLSVYNTGWIVIGVAIASLSFILGLVRFRYTVDAPLKLLFFIFVGAGYVYTLTTVLNHTLTGDDVGALRLAYLAAMPFLPIVVYRMVVDRLTAQIEVKAAQAVQASLANVVSPPPADTEREANALLRSLGMMLEKDAPEELPLQIIMSVASSLKADVAALLVLDDAEYADVIAAYDNVKQMPIAAMALKMDEQPTLREAILEKKQIPLSAEHNLNELVDLYTRLDIQKIGPAYFQPLSREGGVIGALVITLPYTQRDLRPNEQQLLEAMAPIATRLLGISRKAQRAILESEERAVKLVVEGSAPLEFPPINTAARSEMQSSLEVARTQINELGGKVRDLQIELDYERSRIAELSANDPEGLTATQRMARMSAERAQLESEREKLMQALQDAQTRLVSATGSDEEVFSTMVNVLQQERDELQAQKEQLELQLTEIRQRGEAPAPAVLRDVLTNLSEEKARLALERDQIKSQLIEVESQLKSLGIEGGTGGLAAMFLQLTEERSFYKAHAEKATQERDTLLNERARLADQIANEAQREAKITALETDLRRIAEDREALLHQRDSLRNERESVLLDSEKWESQRARMVADMATLRGDLEDAMFENKRILAEVQTLSEDRAALMSDRDKLLAQRTALQTERDQLAARLEGNREMLQRFGADGLGQMKKMIDDLTEERSDLEHQLLKSKSSIQALEEKLSEAATKLAKSVQLPPSITMNASDAEVMLSIAQELRTPMSSIVGYVDLLLGESVGILGALQRQFLNRVKANADRLTSLLEDFIRVTAMDTGQLALATQDIDMVELIDDAITSTKTQFREKGITLKIDVPDSLPAMQGDRDAMQQIMVQLLSNAYLASPTDGEVSIQARLERGYRLNNRDGSSLNADVITVAVRDLGAGIPLEEQERVFTRLYRADNPLIQGLGDTGVGLSIARALVEGHGGRIWVESELGVGSIFKVALPLSGLQSAEKVTE